MVKATTPKSSKKTAEAAKDDTPAPKRSTASSTASAGTAAKTASKPAAGKSTAAKAASKPASAARAAAASNPAPSAPAKTAQAKTAQAKTAAVKPAKASEPKTETKAPAKAAATARTAAKPKAPAKPKTPTKAKAETTARTTAKGPASNTAKAKANGSKTTRRGGVSYSDKPWISSYPENIPGEIAPLADKSIADLLVASCKKYASRTAFTCMGKTLSFSELEKLSQQMAAYLQSKGLAKGARVALMMPNVLQYPVALMAVLRAGYVVVNVNPLYTPRELEHQLKDSGAEAIIILENFAGTLEKVIANTPVKHVVVAAMGDMLGFKGVIVNLVVRRVRKMVPAWNLPGHVKFNDALKQGQSKTFRPADIEQGDIAFLQYTGGTTGISKGAMLLHRNVLANVAQNALWVEAAFARKGRPDKLTYVCALPLYHIYALTVNALMGMQQGANNLLIPNPRDIPGFVKELQKYPFNIFPGLNTLFNALLNNEDFRKIDFKPLILTFGGGMAVQSAVADRWKKLTGIVIAEGYGLSETAPVATANRFDAEEFTGTIGLPLPSTEVAIIDEDGKDVPMGEVGEIAIRGPQVMEGYWNRPDETEKVMTGDGFFKSGDMGFMNEQGFVKIVDRKKDMILVSGFNVYPNEIEDVVAGHPGVLEVAAVGVPDEKSGEVPKIFVVKKDESLTEQALLDYCREQLTAYKRPRSVEFRKELPKTNVGKILRRELR